MTPTLTVTDTGVKASLAQFPRTLQRAAVSAITKTMRRARTEADREVRATYTVQLKDLRAATKFVPATANHPVAKIEATYRTLQAGGRLPLIEFAGRGGKAGASAQIRKGGPRTTYPGAFVATMRSGHRGIFRRAFGRGGVQQVAWWKGIGRHRGKTAYTTTGGKRVYAALPIAELLGPSVKTMYGQESVFQAIKRTVAANFKRIFDHEVTYYLGRR